MEKCCHNCENCMSNEEEYLTCLLTEKLVDFDDYCNNWIFDDEFEEILR